MKKFSYKVKDKVTGKIVKGEISADSKRAAGKALIDQGIFFKMISMKLVKKIR